MNETITLNMENLTPIEREPMMNLVKKANETDKVWKPSQGEIFWTIDDMGSVRPYDWHNGGTDNKLYLIGNCFKTEEDARFEIERLKVIAELKRFAEEHNEGIIDWKNGETDKYFIYYCESNEDLHTDRNLICKHDDIYFTSVKIAQAAIDSIGKNRLKKYYFCVED